MYVRTEQIKFEYKYYPIVDFIASRAADESHWAAYAAECANEQGKFWEYHDKLFAEYHGEYAGTYTKWNLKRYAYILDLDTEMFNRCLDTEETKPIIEADIAQARRMRINSTPTFVLNGKIISSRDLFQAIDTLVKAPTPTMTPTPANSLMRAAMMRATEELVVTEEGVKCEKTEYPSGQFYCQDGERHIVNTNGNLATFITQGSWRFANLVIQAQMRLIGDTGSYGVVFRAQSNPSTFYAFRIRGSGDFQLIRKSQDQAYIVLVPWTSATPIRKGEAFNQLQVIAEGTQISVFVNGDLLATITDSNLREGYAGFAAMEGAHAVTTSMRLWKLP